MARLGAQQRYEEAAGHRDRATAFVRTAARMQRLAALAGAAELVGARPGVQRRLGPRASSATAGWRASSVAPPGAAPRPYIDALVASAEVVTPGPGPLAAAGAEEMERILAWLAEPGARLVELDGQWCSPVPGAGGPADLARASRRRAQRRPTVRRPARAAATAPAGPSGGLSDEPSPVTEEPLDVELDEAELQAAFGRPVTSYSVERHRPAAAAALRDRRRVAGPRRR